MCHLCQGSIFEGRLGWMNFSIDTDINLELIRKDQVGLTAQNERLGMRTTHLMAMHLIEVEFASGEIMARFGTPWVVQPAPSDPRCHG